MRAFHNDKEIKKKSSYSKRVASILSSKGWLCFDVNKDTSNGPDLIKESTHQTKEIYDKMQKERSVLNQFDWNGLAMSIMALSIVFLYLIYFGVIK